MVDILKMADGTKFRSRPPVNPGNILFRGSP
jgi:hypothetical protein